MFTIAPGLRTIAPSRRIDTMGARQSAAGRQPTTDTARMDRRLLVTPSSNRNVYIAPATQSTSSISTNESPVGKYHSLQKELDVVAQSKKDNNTQVSLDTHRSRYL